MDHLYHYAQFGRSRTTHVGVRVHKVMFSLFTGRICPKGSSAGIVFTHGWIFGFSPHRGDMLHDEGEIWQVGPLLTAYFLLDRFRGGGLRPQNFENLVYYTILTKFTGFMHVLSLHKSAKFGCFSLINDKIINNLPWWVCFQPNFR